MFLQILEKSMKTGPSTSVTCMTLGIYVVMILMKSGMSYNVHNSYMFNGMSVHLADYWYNSVYLWLKC